MDQFESSEEHPSAHERASGGQEEFLDSTMDPFDTHMDGAGLIGELFGAGNPEKAVQMAAYMRDQFLFLGLTTPERRAITKSYFSVARRDPRPDWAFVAQCWALPHREFQYVAADYLFAVRKMLSGEDLERVRALAISKPWWDSVDSLQKSVSHIVAANPELKSVMLQWAVDESFWIRRLAIDHQLTWKHLTDEALLAKIIELNLGSTQFFINKAIGWALRDYSKSNPAWVGEFIEAHRADLSALSIREGSKYLGNTDNTAAAATT